MSRTMTEEATVTVENYDRWLNERNSYLAGILRTMMMVNEHLKNCSRIVELLFFKQIVRGSFTGVIVNR